MKSYARALKNISTYTHGPGFIRQKLDQLFLLLEVQGKHHQWLFYHVLERQEKLRMPTQLSCPEQKLEMFVMKKAPFSIFFSI